MSIVNMNFIVTLVNAELPKLLEMLEQSNAAFHAVAEEHTAVSARVSIALQTVAAGSFTEDTEPAIVASARRAQQLHCEMDQHRECVALVREVLLKRVLAMSATKVGYTLAEVEAYRAALSLEAGKETNND